MTLKLFLKTFLSSLVLLFAPGLCVQAQTERPARALEQDAPASRTVATDQNAPQSRTNADESFELNISERRITEERLEASTQVELGGEDERGLNLKVGVAVGAERIVLVLRNVRGSVRFKASLDEVLRRIGGRREAAPQSPP